MRDTWGCGATLRAYRACEVSVCVRRGLGGAAILFRRVKPPIALLQRRLLVIFGKNSRPATQAADVAARQGFPVPRKCRSAVVTTIRSSLAGVRCPAHHSPLTAQPRSHALRAAKQLAAHRSVPVAPAGSASLGSGVPPFPNASDQKLASYVVAASDQSLIDSRRSPGATRHLPPSPRMRSLLHPRSHHHRRRRRRRRRRGALRGS